MLDQVVSSATNFLLVVFVSHATDADSFGAFTLCFSTFLIVLGLARAVTSQVLVLRYASVSTPLWRSGASLAAGTALSIGAIAGALLVATSILLPDFRSEACALGLVMPMLLLQDTWRFAFFAHSSGIRAFASDFTWMVVFLAGAVLLHGAEQWTPTSIIAVWGVSGGAGAVLACVIARTPPRFRGMGEWVVEHRATSLRFLVEFVASSGASQVAMFGVAAVAGLATLGAVRAGLLVFGPLNTLELGLALVAVPEGVRLVRENRARHLLRWMAIGAACFVAAACLWAAAVIVIPWLGQLLAGNSWERQSRSCLSSRSSWPPAAPWSWRRRDSERSTSSRAASAPGSSRHRQPLRLRSGVPPSGVQPVLRSDLRSGLPLEGRSGGRHSERPIYDRSVWAKTRLVATSLSSQRSSSTRHERRDTAINCSCARLPRHQRAMEHKYCGAS